MAQAAVLTTHPVTAHAHGPQERRCRSCYSTALHVDAPAGDRVCTNCGVVDEQHLLDETPEWRDHDKVNPDEAPGAATRCGLIANNEDKWIGGLQPTTLSSYIYGGPTPESSRLRKTLIKMNQRLDKQVEKRHKKAWDDARLGQRIRKRQRAQGVVGEDDSSSGARPEFEEMLIHEEDNALAATAALYADKWNLARCLVLFGQPDEQPLEQPENVEDLRRRLDSTLVAASQQLYRAHSILIQTGRNLKLSDRVLNEAASHLSGYATKRDSLAVRGVSSQLKRNPHKKVSEVCHKQAREALRDYNQVKQYSALATALLFYTARRLGHPRPLADVCRAIPTNVVQTTPFLECEQQPLLKLKHCSRAMAEVKQIFPDLTTHVHGGGPTTTQSARMDAGAVQNFVAHATRSLQLPPVAEASLQVLAGLELPEKMATRTASLAYFVGAVGRTMQRLAAQSTPRKRPRQSPFTAAPGAKSVIPSFVEPDTVGSLRMDVDEDAEQLAYEMQRVWSVWKDQTPWWRPLAEIAQATQVPPAKILSDYRQHVFPQRQALLQALSCAPLEQTPLSSVLLPHIALAAPLLKDS
jgi:hypothetical protein